MSARAVERRAAPRIDVPAVPRIFTCRVNPGHEVQLLNVSGVGALVEASFTLRPGRSLQLHVQGPGPRVVIESRVVRSVVMTVTPHRGVQCRAGLMFSRWVDVAAEIGLTSSGADPRPRSA